MKLSDGMFVLVNMLIFDGKFVVLVGLYLKNMLDVLEVYMKMFFEKECLCLVVLMLED